MNKGYWNIYIQEKCEECCHVMDNHNQVKYNMPRRDDS